jgi:serine/threonine-protein kinase RsbT
VIPTEAETVVERMQLETEVDIVRIRQTVRRHGKERGMGLIDQTRITTAASEILRNMYVYGGGGEAVISFVTYEGRPALMITCRDEGPGIADIALAMQDGYSTSKSLGSGLPGARRLVDRLEVESTPGTGTTVWMLKVLPC